MKVFLNLRTVLHVTIALSFLGLTGCNTSYAPPWGEDGIIAEDFVGQGTSVDSANDGTVTVGGFSGVIYEDARPVVLSYGFSSTKNIDFGTGGKVDILNAFPILKNNLLLDSDYSSVRQVVRDVYTGNIYLLLESSNNSLVVVSLTSSGSPNAAFRAVNSGVTSPLLPAVTNGLSIVIGPSGVLPGVLPNGYPDAAFIPIDMVMQTIDNSDGTHSIKLVIVATSLGQDSRAMLVRLNSDGTLDSTFGTGGIFTTKFGFEQAFGIGLTIDPAGRTIFIGQGMNNNGANMHLAISMVDANGVLNTSFGTAGVLKKPSGYYECNNQFPAASNNPLAVSRSNLTGDYTVQGAFPGGIARFSQTGQWDTAFPDSSYDSLWSPDRSTWYYQLREFNDGKLLELRRSNGKYVPWGQELLVISTHAAKADSSETLGEILGDGWGSRFTNGSWGSHDGIGLISIQGAAMNDFSFQSLQNRQGQYTVVTGALNGKFATWRFKPDGKPDAPVPAAN